MKCYKLFIGLLLCIVLVAYPIQSSEVIDLDTDTKINTLNAMLPDLAGLIAMTVTTLPAGAILAGALGMLHVCAMIIIGKDGDGEKSSNALTNADIFEVKTQIIDKIDNLSHEVKEGLQRVIDEVLNGFKSFFIKTGIRNDIDIIERYYNDKLNVIINPKITGVQKNSAMSTLLEFGSPILEKVRSLIAKYIKPARSTPMDDDDDSSYIYELMLQAHALKVRQNIDSCSDSIHSKIFKTYMYIAKGITDGYVITIVTHATQYQKEMKNQQFQDAQATKANGELLINSYKNDMKALIEKTKWALNKASREIKNPAKYPMKEGVTSATLKFALTIPRTFNLEQNGCSEGNIILNLKDFHIGNCNTYGNIFPTNSQLSIYSDPTDVDSPYKFMKVRTPSGEPVIYGHNISSPNLVEQQATISDECPTVFCPVFKKNAIGISTQRVRADYGNVITGVRFRVEIGILYIDIQQGKLIDIISVDPKTVFWTKTPPGGPVLYLSSKLSKLQLGDLEVEDKHFLTSIQLKVGPQRDVIKFSIEGTNGPNGYISGPITVDDRILQKNELQFREIDDPECLIIPPPIQGEAYHISMRPSDFSSDFGRTTFPIIGLRELVTNPPAPLSGLGLFVTGCGTVEPKLIQPNMVDMPNYEQIEQFTRIATMA